MVHNWSSSQNTGLTLALSVCAASLLATHGRADLGGTRTVDVIRGYGYSAEELSVTTQDGYILALTHIKSSGTRLPVLMVHGVTAASDTWVLQGPRKDLALLLVDEGHDVWLGDLRGNHYTLNHTVLKPSDPLFWSFSFHEMGLYDVPLFVDTVLAQSGSKQLQYIGHSMGTTVFMVMCSLRPEYNNKIHMSVLMSPVAFKANKNLSQILRLILPQANGIARGLESQGVHQLLGRTPSNQLFVELICTKQNKQLCQLLVNQSFGPETEITDVAKLRTYLIGVLSCTSLKTALHFAQIFNSKRFAQFDYGRTVNYIVYKSKTPPSYPLEKVTCPVALFYSDKDAVVDDASVEKLRRILPNVKTTFSVPRYNHIDILFADSAADLLYRKVLRLLN